jgi:serine/threonine-protein kinase
VAGTAELDASFNLQRTATRWGAPIRFRIFFPRSISSRFDPQTKVSRRHARIWRDGESYMVEDLGSVNGTVINDIIRLVPRQPRPLDSGDRIKLGETTLHFLIG